MKDISSVIGQLVQNAEKEQNGTGEEPSETGYRKPRRRSSETEEQPHRNLPSAAQPSSVQITTGSFQTFSPLPPSKPVTLVSANGYTRTVMALADPSDLSLVREEIERLQEELAPPSPMVVAARIRVLLMHYGQ